jgi:hypothetical protein
MRMRERNQGEEVLWEIPELTKAETHRQIINSEGAVMLVGTSHFISKTAAGNYYRKQDPEHRALDTDDKIKEGLITIGRPVMNRKYHQFVDGDGRWCYIEYEGRKAVKK